MNGIVVEGSGRYLPPLQIENEAFTAFLDTSDEWIRTRSGIQSRRFSDREPVWSMGMKAAVRALEKAELKPEDLDLILVTTVTSDYMTPSLACVLQGRIGATKAVAFDINCACAGFVYALDLARRYLMTEPEMRHVLIVSAEMLSRIVDFTDRSTCVLFGDGAGAAVITRSDSLFSSSFMSDGSGAGHIFGRTPGADNPFCASETQSDPDGYGEMKDGKIHMNGREVYKFATRVMPEMIEEVVKKARIGLEEIDLIIPHQANLRIIETAAQRLGLPMEKFAINIEKYGNTSSACIPICLDEVVESGRLKKGDRVCMVGFGAGLTAGAVLMEW